LLAFAIILAGEAVPRVAHGQMFGITAGLAQSNEAP
jgi:hypothetical protein